VITLQDVPKKLIQFIDPKKSSNINITRKNNTPSHKEIDPDADFFYMNEINIENLEILLNNLPNNYAVDYYRWISITESIRVLCHGNTKEIQEKIKQIWNKWSQSAPDKYSKVENSYKWDTMQSTFCFFNLLISALNTRLLKKDRMTFYFIKTKRYFPLRGLDDIGGIEVINDHNNRYVTIPKENNIFKNPVQMIKAPQGTGKTYYAGRCISDIKKDDPQTKTIFISSRCSLGKQHVKTYNDHVKNEDDTVDNYFYKLSE